MKRSHSLREKTNLSTLTLHPITRDPLTLQYVRDLYTTAFPEHERIPFQIHQENPHGHGEALAIYESERFCGLLFLLNHEALSHITYFAILPSLRNQGYGHRALETLIREKVGKTLLADLESLQTATNEEEALRQRRYKFYLRSGFCPTHLRYRWQSETYDILAHGPIPSQQDYQRFWATFAKVTLLSDGLLALQARDSQS